MIPSYSSLLLFLTGAIIILVIPGPAVFYITSRAIGQGRAAGLVSAGGIATGTLGHCLAATLGLSALLVSSALAFQCVKYLGAAYLVYLGIRTLRRSDLALVEAVRERPLHGRIFGQGMLVQLLNPKAALFFLAFLPQFVEPARGHATAQILFLGILFTVIGYFSDSAWALLAGTLAGRIRQSAHWRSAQRNLSGCGLIALGVACAFSGARSK